METKYLRFSIIEKKPKTKVYGVFSISSGEKIAEIKWYGAWRQYCFFPITELVTIWNRDCLMDIINFLYDLNVVHENCPKPNQNYVFGQDSTEGAISTPQLFHTFFP